MCCLRVSTLIYKACVVTLAGHPACQLRSAAHCHTDDLCSPHCVCVSARQWSACFIHCGCHTAPFVGHFCFHATAARGAVQTWSWTLIIPGFRSVASLVTPQYSDSRFSKHLLISADRCAPHRGPLTPFDLYTFYLYALHVILKKFRFNRRFHCAYPY